jgi:hypothetical protein
VSELNPAQEMQLELIRLTSFNELDGGSVAADLRAHPDLWKAAALHQPDVGVTLTYLDLGWSAADTIYVLPSGHDDEALKALAESWKPSRVTWEKGVAGPDEGRVLCVWWD